MTWLLDRWSTWIAGSLTETAALILIVWLIDRAGERRVWPEVRNGLWLLVLLKLFVPPTLVPVPAPGSASIVDASAAAAGIAGAASAVWVVWLWMAGAVITGSMWLVRARRAATRLRAAADRDALAAAERRVADEARAIDFRHHVAVAIDSEATLPYVTGLFRPRLVLPADWRAWTPASLSHAIGHELCHLSRRDLWIEAAWMCAAALYWFHPLVHVARRRAHTTRELCCDAAAARRFGGGYRQSLLQLAGRAAFGDRSAGALSMPHPHHGWGPVVSRLKALERWPGRISRARRLASLLTLAAAAGAIVPSWTTFAPPAAITGITDAILLDPVRRQEAGLGSMHVRYQLMRASQQQGTDR